MAVSQDNGYTWSDYRSELEAPLRGPSSRFAIMKLQSGNLILINNASETSRTALTAYLSADGGKTESTVKSAPIKKERRAYVTLRSFLLISNYHLLSDSNIFFNTVWAEISRFAASGMTMLCGLSITSSVTIMLRRTGRQCMK